MRTVLRRGEDLQGKLSISSRSLKGKKGRKVPKAETNIAWVKVSGPPKFIQEGGAKGKADRHLFCPT